MFLGTYEHTIDDKGRLTIPVRFRELLADGAYITRGFDGNLIVWTTTLFQQVSRRLNGMNTADNSSRLLRRLIFGFADRAEMDKIGRILIQQFLRDAAHLESSVVVVGAGDYFEIWSPDQWAKQQTQLVDPSTTAERFVALDLST
jgi:MraZ protein